MHFEMVKNAVMCWGYSALGILILKLQSYTGNTKLSVYHFGD